MNLVVTFNVGELSIHLGRGLTTSNQWEWNGRCNAEIILDDGASVDAIREIREISNWSAELTVVPISKCGDHLRNLHVLSKLSKQPVLSKFSEQPVAQKLEEELSAAQANDTADATIVWKYEEKSLGVTIGLRPQRYELFRTFLTLHFGRPDLIGRISGFFVGFAASTEGGLHIPNYNEFLAGRPYLILNDSSIWFSAKPLSEK